MDNLKEFLTDLRDLLNKYGVEINAEATAEDDTGLECWLTVDKVTEQQHGRWGSRTRTTVLEIDDITSLTVQQEIDKLA